MITKTKLNAAAKRNNRVLDLFEMVENGEYEYGRNFEKELELAERELFRYLETLTKDECESLPFWHLLDLDYEDLH